MRVKPALSVVWIGQEYLFAMEQGQLMGLLP